MYSYKIILAFLAIVFSSTFLRSQGIIERQITHPLIFGFSDMIQTGDNGFLLSGSARPQNFDSIISILIKTDSQFEVEWAKRYKIQNEDDLSVLQKLSDGNILVGGKTTSNFTIMEGASLFKMDVEGNVIWQKVYGNDTDFRILEVFEREDQSLMIFIREGVTNQPTIIVHADSEGNIISERIYSFDNMGVFAESVVLDSNGDYILSGHLLDVNTVQFEVFLCAVNESTMLWYERFDLPRSATTYGLCIAENGDIIAGGNILEDKKSNISNPWIMRLNPTGSLIWLIEYPDVAPDSQFMAKISPSDDGGFIFHGRNSNFETSDILAIKINDTGDLVWSYNYIHFDLQFGGNGYVLPDNRIFIPGSAEENAYLLLLDENGIAACSNEDVFFDAIDMLATQSTMSPTVDIEGLVVTVPAFEETALDFETVFICDGEVSVYETVEKELLIYPVPATDRIYLELEIGSEQVNSIEMIGSDGKSIRLPALHQNGRLEVNVSSLSPGIYTALIRLENEAYRARFMK